MIRINPDLQSEQYASTERITQPLKIYWNNEDLIVLTPINENLSTIDLEEEINKFLLAEKDNYTKQEKEIHKKLNTIKYYLGD